MPDEIVLPDHLRPADGRFGSGPTKVRPEFVDALAATGTRLLGTSHRQRGVKDLVRRIRQGLLAYYDAPDGYEVALGNGGATLFWDAAAFSLVRQRSAHAVFGEFSSKFAAAVRAAPFLADPVIVESAPGTGPTLEAVEGVDLYALTHNETSTGVMMPVQRPAGAGEALVAVDATSAAGVLPVDLTECDAYYFSPQKAFGSEGGLWLALLSPAAIARLDQVAAGGRHLPAMLDVRLALDNARQDQTYNTPAIATLFLLAEQLDWLSAQGGLAAAAKEGAAKAGLIYDWAEARTWAAPFVADPAQRSHTVCTVDLDAGTPAAAVTAALRANGIVDIDAYRKLGRNQLRIGVFPAVEAADVERLLAAIDHIAERVRG